MSKFYTIILIAFILLSYAFIHSTQFFVRNISLNSETSLLGAREAGKRSELENAIKLYSQSISKNQESNPIKNEFLSFLIHNQENNTAINNIKKFKRKYHNFKLNKDLQALLYIKNHNLKASEELMQKYSKKEIPASLLVAYPIMKSWALFQDGKEKEALAILDSWKDTMPNIYYTSVARMYASKHKYNEALNYYNQSMNQGLSVENSIEYSYLLYKNHQVASAIEFYNTMVSDTLIHNSNIEKEIASHNIQFTLNESLSWTFYYISGVLSSSGQYKYAEDFIEYALWLNPHNNFSKVRLALLKNQNGNYISAAKILLQVPSRSYIYKTQYSEAVDIFLNMNYDKKITKDLLIVGKDGANPIAFIERGLIYNKKGRYKKAINNLDIAEYISIKNNNQNATWLSLYLKGVAYTKLGDWKNAEINLLKALNINKNDATLLNWLAYSWLERDINISRATKMLETALKLDPLNPALIDSYGWAMFKNKKYQEAKTLLKQAISMEPYNYLFNDHLGDIEWKMGNPHLAIYQWRIALNLNPTDIEHIRIKNKLQGNLPNYLS